MAGDFLPLKLMPFADDARYFMSLLLRKLSRRQVDRRGLVRLRAEHLRSVMHSRHAAGIVEALVNGGAVERFAYLVGRYPFGFRVGGRFVADKHVMVPARDARLIERIRLAWERAEVKRLARMQPVHHELARRQEQLQIDPDAARRILAGIPPASNPFDVQGVLVENIVHAVHHFSVGNYGRVANSITSMSRKLRPSLLVNHEPLASVDLSCAQPALLAKLCEDRQYSGTSYMLCSRVPPFPSPLPSSSVFCKLALTGVLYDFLQERLDLVGIHIPREKLKKKLLQDVIAKRKKNAAGDEYQSDVEDIFRQQFPAEYAFIRDFNHDGWKHENLIRELQRQESQFVIELVAADLLRTHPGTFIITLHDAIFAAASDLPKVEAAFQSGFEKVGFRMTYKIATAKN